MIRFAKIKRMVSAVLVEIKGLGGVTQNRFISPKGLYSKPKNEDSIVIPLMQGRNQDIILAVQKEVKLNDGDVYLTDDVSHIHLKFNGKSIELKTKDLIFNVENFTVNAKKVNFNGCSIKNDGTSIDKGHTHGQNSGNELGGGATTSSPNN